MASLPMRCVTKLVNIQIASSHTSEYWELKLKKSSFKKSSLTEGAECPSNVINSVIINPRGIIRFLRCLNNNSKTYSGPAVSWGGKKTWVFCWFCLVQPLLPLVMTGRQPGVWLVEQTPSSKTNSVVKSSHNRQRKPDSTQAQAWKINCGWSMPGYRRK